MRFIALALISLFWAGSLYAQIAPPSSPPMNGLPGQPAGPLTAGGRVPDNQLSVSAFQYKGVWNASTNTPALANGTGTTGDTYEIGTSGTQNLGGGSVNYLAGNLLLYNGTEWQQAGSENVPVPANPTSSVGTSAINGVASTFMRSDAAPAVNLTMSPTWTGTHTFSNTVTVNEFNGIALAPAADGGVPSITTVGGNNNVSLNIGTKGSGGINLSSNTSIAGTLNVAPGGTSQLTVDGSDIAAGASYTPANAQSLATKQYVDTAIGSPTTLASGTYTPAVTFTNNASTPFVGTFFYQRVGNVVNVTGIITIDVTNSASAGNVRISLPIASNFTLSNQLTGFCSATLTPGAGSCSASAFSSENTATMTVWATSSGAKDYGVTFSYTVQ